jgi:hypothetical protein
MNEALYSTETSVFTRVKRCNILEDAILHSHRRENLKSYVETCSWTIGYASVEVKTDTGPASGLSTNLHGCAELRSLLLTCVTLYQGVMRRWLQRERPHGSR